MLPNEGVVLCAVSGGADSMGLLLWLSELAGKYGFSVAAAHFNHGLRGEAADRDERFVRDLCAERNIPFYCGRGDVAAAARERGWSIEEAGRNLRYRFLEETAQKIGAVRIATAHHRGDDAETVLLNLIRGSGLAGLCGIAPVRGIFIRPLLDTPRREIEEYLTARGVSWVNDESNDTNQYARNRIRHEVLPLLREMNPKIEETLHQTAQLLRKEDAYLQKVTARTCGGVRREGNCVSLARAALLDLPEGLQGRVVRQMLGELGTAKKDIAARHIRAVLEMAARSGPTAQLSLPHGIVARNAGEYFEISRRQRGDWTPVKLPPVGEAVIGPWRIRCRVTREAVLPKSGRLILNNAAIQRTVCVERWCRGGRLCLPGMEGSRSLKRLFLDAGLSVKQREEVPVVYVDGAAAAVPGIGADRAFAGDDAEWKYILDFEAVNFHAEAAHEEK